MRRVRQLLATGALSVLLAGCASAGGGPEAGAPTTAGTPAPEPAPSGSPAPDPLPSALAPLAGAATLDGGQLQAGDLAGRDVAVWFWSPW